MKGSDSHLCHKMDIGTYHVLGTVDKNEIKKDSPCKIILRYIAFLAVILKYAVEEFKGWKLKDIEKCIVVDSVRTDRSISKNLTNCVTGESEENVSINERNRRFDLVFKVKILNKEKKDSFITLNIDIEAQKSYYPGYPIEKRAVYYLSRLLSSEFNGTVEDIDYNELYKIYSIFICFNAPKKITNTITRLKIDKEDLYGSSVELKKENYDLMEAVIIRLGTDYMKIGQELFDMLYAVYYSDTPKSRIENLNDLGFNGPEMEDYMKDDITIEEWFEIRAKIKIIKRSLKEGIPISTIAKIVELPEYDIEYFSKEGELPPPPEYR